MIFLTDNGYCLMIKVAVSGAMGRLGRAIAGGVATAGDMQLSGLYAPGHEGESFAGLKVCGNPDNVSAQLIVECAPADAVMAKLRPVQSDTAKVRFLIVFRRNGLNPF